MPPKKASASKAKAPPSKTPAATAASERPRRAATTTPAPTPSKKATAKEAPAKASTTKTTEPTKKRGHPSKAEQTEAEPEADKEEPPKKRGRGRPPKSDGTSSKDTPAVPEQETAPPKKRGRPPKGGETSKDPKDDPAAAEQLEDELDDAVEADQEEATSKPAPAKKGKGAVKGKGRKVNPAEGERAVNVDAIAADEDKAEMEGADTTAGKNFWLMKAEQVDREEKLQDGSFFNTKFTIDNLRDKGGPEPWDGVRNPTACKNMREMKLGDFAFFYASGAKGKAVQPGIVGIMEIVKEHEPDTSAFDEKNPYFVQNAKQRGTPESPRWYMVHVEHRKKLSKPVTLKELQQYKHPSGVLANMQEFTAARLSVSKVTEKEWNFIVDNLIEGYEENDAAPTTTAAIKNDSLPSKGREDSIVPHAAITINGTAGPAEGDLVPTSETAAPKDTTSRASSRKPSTSRAASRKPSTSRASSKAPQDKLAPPRAQSRDRSRTSVSRAGSVKPAQDGLKGVAEETETMEK